MSTNSLASWGKRKPSPTLRSRTVLTLFSGRDDLDSHRARLVLAAKGVTGVRLSCQIACDADMSVRCTSRLAGSGRADAGKRPTDDIAPPPVWATK